MGGAHPNASVVNTVGCCTCGAHCKRDRMQHRIMIVQLRPCSSYGPTAQPRERGATASRCCRRGLEPCPHVHGHHLTAAHGRCRLSTCSFVSWPQLELRANASRASAVLRKQMSRYPQQTTLYIVDPEPTPAALGTTFRCVLLKEGIMVSGASQSAPLPPQTFTACRLACPAQVRHAELHRPRRRLLPGRRKPLHLRAGGGCHEFQVVHSLLCCRAVDGRF